MDANVRRSREAPGVDSAPNNKKKQELRVTGHGWESNGVWQMKKKSGKWKKNCGVRLTLRQR